METKLTNMVISETPIPKELYNIYAQELKTIRTIVKARNNDSPQLDLQIKKVMKLSSPDIPSSTQLEQAQGNSDLPYSNTAMLSNKQGGQESDYKTEYPDFKNRASNASFNPSVVGTLNYKERSKNLCGQISGTNLGDPTEFGCIQDQESVGSDYSWKGNFEMVCSRLKNTWGGWYPEMLGCSMPK